MLLDEVVNLISTGEVWHDGEDVLDNSLLWGRNIMGERREEFKKLVMDRKKEDRKCTVSLSGSSFITNGTPAHRAPIAGQGLVQLRLMMKPGS